MCHENNFSCWYLKSREVFIKKKITSALFLHVNPGFFSEISQKWSNYSWMDTKMHFSVSLNGNTFLHVSDAICLSQFHVKLHWIIADAFCVRFRLMSLENFPYWLNNIYKLLIKNACSDKSKSPGKKMFTQSMKFWLVVWNSIELYWLDSCMQLLRGK